MNPQQFKATAEQAVTLLSKEHARLYDGLVGRMTAYSARMQGETKADQPLLQRAQTLKADQERRDASGVRVGGAAPGSIEARRIEFALSTAHQLGARLQRSGDELTFATETARQALELLQQAIQAVAALVPPDAPPPPAAEQPAAYLSRFR